jgi:hypothetical protein
MKTRLILLCLIYVCRLPAQVEVVSSGNVGIGTSSPTAKLEVNGTGVFSGWIAGNGAAGTALSLFGSKNDAWGKDLTLKDGNVGLGTTTPSIAGGFTPKLHLSGPYAALAFEATTPAKKWGMGVDSNGALDFFESTANSYSSRLIITNTGNVGIGTGTPAEKLQVMGNVQVGNGSPSNYHIRHRTSTNWDYYFAADGDDYKIYDAQSSTYLRFRYAGGGGNKHTIVAETLYAFSGGNVGIGTASPSQKLEVSGSVKATSFISSTTTYADFVFKPDYRLPALSEVEAHIKTHGHLPGVPSEAQVAKEGIDLAAMQVKLLQKVEELTLHAIAQQKEISALRQELAAFKNR